MALLCMLFPAAVFCHVRNRLSGIRYEWSVDGVLGLLFEYLCGNALINTIVIVSRMVISHAAGDIYKALNEYSDLAVKYLLVAVLLACVLPYVEISLSKLSRDWAFDFHLDIGTSHARLSDKAKACIVWSYGVVMALHHLIRLFDDCFWGDEGIVVQAARMSWGAMLNYVAVNGHSPFHYAFAWICVNVFGESGFIYHLSATLPYFITVVFTVTSVRRWFGNKASVVLVTLSTLLGSAVTYNLELRMYAWSQMFLFATYLMLYGSYKTKKDIYLVLMSISSLGAVYSHYFALASIGLLYLVLLVYIAKIRYRDIWKVLLSGGTVAALLLPWLIFAKKTSGMVISNYRLSAVSWQDCIGAIFHSEYSTFLLTLFFVTLSVRVVYDLGLIKIKVSRDDKKVLDLRIKLRDIQLDTEWVWIISGSIAVFGTIAISEMISVLVYPIIVLRYLYPSFIMIWLLFAIDISKCKLGRLWTVLLVIFIFMTCYPTYLDTIKNERENDRRLKSTLAATTSEMDGNDLIYTNILHFDWTVADVYYPEIQHELFGCAKWWGTVEIPALDRDMDHWLFLGAPVSEEVTSHLGDMGYGLELVVDCGYIGTGDVWIYKVVPEVEDEGGRL